MTERQILRVALIVMILLNAFLLIRMFGRGHERPDPSAVIIDRLELDADQQEIYEGFIADHRGVIAVHQEEMQSLRVKLYALLKKEESNGSDALAQAIGDARTEIETAHYDHFMDIRSLCRPDQQAAFDSLTSDLSRIFAPSRPTKGRKKK